MMRIKVVSQTPEEAVLKIEGWIAGTEVVLLEEEGQSLLHQSRRLVLDLSEVRNIDPEGIVLLRRWARRKVALQGGSLYIRALLQKHGLR